jgi:hypothetical protein
MEYTDTEGINFDIEYQDGYLYVEGLLYRIVEETGSWYEYDVQNFIVNLETEDTFDQWELAYAPTPIYELVTEMLDKKTS